MTKKPPPPTILADASNCCFFSNYNFNLTSFFLPSTYDSLRHLGTESPLLPDSIQSKAPYFLELTCPPPKK